jgi:hypothetical protein
MIAIAHCCRCGHNRPMVAETAIPIGSGRSMVISLMLADHHHE